MHVGKTILILLLSGMYSGAVAAPGDEKAPQKDVTYSRDVAPILQKHCTGCHRPNDMAPMSLMTYDEVMPFARMIRERVVQRKMPPWHADAVFGNFTNDLQLRPMDTVYVPTSTIGDIDTFVQLYIKNVLPISPGVGIAF